MPAENWRSYQTASDAYRSGRPSYPAAALDALLQGLELEPGSRVADLGAGTGIFSALLAERGLIVDAVEPVDAMRAEIPTSPQLVAHRGTAEATGLEAKTFDGVVAATAWHWFDPTAASAEAQRILRLTGGLGLVWTGYDEEVPWVAELVDISARRRPTTSPRGQSKYWREAFEMLPGWEPLQRVVVSSTWRTTPDALVQRLRSSSVIAALASTDQDQAVGELEELLRAQGLAEADEVEMPYSTEALWAQRTALA